jgi:peptidoglycan-N-acetylglucosamine deacetylase
MKFYSTPSIIRKLYPGLVWRVETGKKEIFLTFDDGPSPQLTHWILSNLAKYNAKASFFCVGENLVRYPKIVQDMKIAGHLVANHTYNHLNGWKTDDDTYINNIEKCEALTNNKIFRPPYGKIKKSQRLKLLSMNYRIIMWDLLTYDFDPELNKEKSMEKIRGITRPGSIIVFHDNIKSEENLRFLLPKTLEYFANLGYSFSSL